MEPLIVFITVITQRHFARNTYVSLRTVLQKPASIWGLPLMFQWSSPDKAGKAIKFRYDAPAFL